MFAIPTIHVIVGNGLMACDVTRGLIGDVIATGLVVVVDVVDTVGYVRTAGDVERYCVKIYNNNQSSLFDLEKAFDNRR